MRRVGYRMSNRLWQWMAMRPRAFVSQMGHCITKASRQQRQSLTGALKNISSLAHKLGCRNTSGGGNTATGFQALFSNSTGEGNNAFGDTALTSNGTGDFNNAFGTRALFATTGDNNTAVGDDAGRDVSTGSGN